jgi:hypothetical protein
VGRPISNEKERIAIFNPQNIEDYMDPSLPLGISEVG